MKKEIEPFKWYPSSIIPTEENLIDRQKKYDEPINFLLAFKNRSEDYSSEDRIEDYPSEEFSLSTTLKDLENSHFWMIFPEEMSEYDYPGIDFIKDLNRDTRPSRKLEEFILSSNNLGFLVADSDYCGFRYQRLKDEDLVINNPDDADFFYDVEMAVAIPALPDDDDVQQMLAEYESES